MKHTLYAIIASLLCIIVVNAAAATKTSNVNASDAAVLQQSNNPPSATLDTANTGTKVASLTKTQRQQDDALVQGQSDETHQLTPSLWARIGDFFGITKPGVVSNTSMVALSGNRSNMQQQYAQLQGAYLQLQHQQNRIWFIMGAIMLLVGMAIGSWLTRRRYQRRLF